MVMVVSSNSTSRSQSFTMLDDNHQRQRKRFVSIDERQSVRGSNASMMSRAVEDSTEEWVDEDDEYSCNSSSEVSDPQLLDDTPDAVRQSASLRYTTNSHSGTAMIVDDDDDDDDDGDSDTQSTTNNHRPCYESSHREMHLSHPATNWNFCWLPNHSNKVNSPVSSNGNVVPYHNYIYIGIPHNPPTVCSEGTGRGNVRSLHRKAWLEVSDSQHRYGKHLRMYYRHWESLYILNSNCNQNHDGTTAVTSARGTFFDWLDSKGKHFGQVLPEISDCPRAVLDSDTVTYIDDVEESKQFAVRIVTMPRGVGRLVRANGSIVRTGSAGWMFVIRDNVMYVAPKVIKCAKRFHHSSFFGGRAVQAAGIIVTDETNGYIQQVLPHSGHYRPGESDVQRVLYFLSEMGVCWSTFTVDVQQFLFVDRSSANTTSPSCYLKKKKVESLHLLSAVTVSDFLSHKARCLQPNGIFAQVEARRCSINYVMR